MFAAAAVADAVGMDVVVAVAVVDDNLKSTSRVASLASNYLRMLLRSKCLAVKCWPCLNGIQVSWMLV